jgi:hypothetical protein
VAPGCPGRSAASPSSIRTPDADSTPVRTVRRQRCRSSSSLNLLGSANQILRLRAAAHRAAAVGAVSGEQAARWLAQLEEADRVGRFFGGITDYIAAGRKP